MAVTSDIDIDLPRREHALAGLWHVPAALNTRGVRSPHRSGVYFQNLPLHPRDGLAVFDHKQAASRGYFKIDFLTNHLYAEVRDEDHLDRLIATEPPWALLDDEAIVGMLAHIGQHHAVVQTITPRSVEDLAICLALLRPGKRHLIGRPRAVIDAEIWKPSESYAYKKSHAIAYALSIVVQLNLLVEKAEAGDGA